MQDNIYLVNNNSYRVKLSYYENGQQKFIGKTFSFKKYSNKSIALSEAKKYRDEMRYKLNIKSFLIPEEYDLSGLYELRKVLIPKEAETERKLDYYFKKYFDPNLVINKVTPADIQCSLNKMTSTCTDDTIKRVLSMWRDLYKVCYMKELNISDKTLAVIPPKSRVIKVKREMDYDMNNFQDLLDKIIKYNNCHYDSYLISLSLRIMYVTGMRPAEVYALTKKDINLDSKTITINKSSNGELTITKNDYSNDVIPISESSIPLFKEVLKLKNNQLFIRKDGKLLDSRYVTHVCNEVSKGTFRPYMMRHKFSTELLDNNIDLRTIGELMRHKDINQVLRYARSNEQKRKKQSKTDIYNY